MELLRSLLVAVALLAAPASAHCQQKTAVQPNGPYLGQAPPATTPVVFAPGFISTGYGELNSVFTENGSEFYFSRRGVPGKPSAIMFTRMEGGTWTVPQPVSFSGKNDDVDLFITPDGKSMIFCSGAAQPQGSRPHPDHDFRISRRSRTNWSDPVPFAPEAASDYEDYYPVVTRSGNLYFNSQRAGRGTNDIYCSKSVNGRYEKPEKLPGTINTPYREFDAYVTQDEKMIIFSSDKPGGFGGADLYVSLKKADGSWSEPRNLGESVNSEFSEYGATITPDGRYLFFTSNRHESEDIYWVSARVLEAK